MNTENTENTTTTAEKRSATIEKNRTARITERGYALPLVLTCQVTGKQVKYTSPSYIDKVIARAGSLEKLQATFTSREGRRAPAKA
jgi:hypothetical protein